MSDFKSIHKIISIQKASLNTAYQIAVLAQERMGMLVDLYSEQISWIPSEQKRLFGQWSENVKQGQKELKKTIDRNFDALISAYGAE